MENLKIKKFKFKNFIFIALITFVLSVSFNFVFAEGTGGLVPCIDDCTAEDLFGNPGNYAEQPPIWTALIRSALGISGIVILLWFIYGGILLMISSGDPKKVTKAKTIMKESVFGLLIVVFAYTFVKFIVMILAGNNWKLFFGGQ